MQMQKMTSTVRDETAKIERKVKNDDLTVLWTYLSVKFTIFYILGNILSHKCHLFCIKGIFKISKILFDSKY